MKKYIFNTLIQSFVIGLVIWFLENKVMMVDNPPSLIWRIGAFIIAIVGMDFWNRNKIFSDVQYFFTPFAHLYDQNKSSSRDERGFNLIELIIVMVIVFIIILILAIVAIRLIMSYYQ